MVNSVHGTEFIGPQPGPQTMFLSTPADIAIYGGQAGGGKTYGLLIEGMRHINNPRFGAVIFRRTTEQVRTEGGLWDESKNIYLKAKGKPREQFLEWRFPSGANIRFEHLQYEKDKYDYQGAQICYIGFDELTHFTESQFFYMLSRNRSTCGVKPYVRATCNPDANSWVKAFIAPWVDPDFPNPAKSGEIRYFVRSDDEGIKWVPAGTPNAKSLTFIGASIYDNKILMREDPSYLANLMALPLIERKRLLEGDWSIVESGNMFRHEWFEIVGWPSQDHMRKLRFWDVAATKKTDDDKKVNDPDWTVGVLMGVTQYGIWYVLDVKRVRQTPFRVEKLIRSTAEIDGRSVAIRMEQEPGSSGISVISHYSRNVLVGFDFRGIKSTGNKVDRAKPYSSACENGNVKLVQGSWNTVYMNELLAFPTKGVKDDQVDASSGAFNQLAKPYEFVADGDSFNEFWGEGTPSAPETPILDGFWG